MPDSFLTQEAVFTEELTFDYSKIPWIAVDTEYLSFDLNQDRLCAIQLASPKEGAENELNIEVVWVWNSLNPKSEAQNVVKEQLTRILARTDVELIMHVASADLPRLQIAAGVEFKGSVFDTKVASRILFSNSHEHGLVYLIQTLLDPKYNEEKQNYTQLDLAPNQWDDKLVQYTVKDVFYLHALRERLLEVAKRRGQVSLIKHAMKTLPHLASLYQAGYTEKVLSY